MGRYRASFPIASLLMVSVVSAGTWNVTSLSQCFQNSSCLTLSQVAANTTRYFTDNTTLILLPGDHLLDSQLIVKNIFNLEIFGSSNVTVSCTESGRFDSESVSSIHIKDIVFSGCQENCVTFVDHLMIERCHFHGRSPNLGIGLHIQQALQGNIIGSSFSSYNNSFGFGGALRVSVCTLNIINCLFQYNIANLGGAIFSNESSVINIGNSTFHSNLALYTGGAIHAWLNANDTITINNSLFVNNTANYGGAIYSEPYYNIVLYSTGSGVVMGGSILAENCTFIGSVAKLHGGTIYVGSIRNMTFTKTRIINSTANSLGGVLYFLSSVFVSRGFLEIENSQGGVGVVFALQSEILLSGRNVMTNNCGPFVAAGCNVTFQGHTNLLHNEGYRCAIPHVDAGLQQRGGAVTTFESTVVFEGRASLIGNQAENGGAITALQSKFYLRGDITISNNSALLSGGCIYAYQSELNFMGNISIMNNTAGNEGGGIHAISSTTVLMQGALSFRRNIATLGGGIFLESNAKLYLIKPISLHCDTFYCAKEGSWSIYFIENSADHGGAIYVSDSSNYGVCDGILSTTTSECFFQSFAYLPVHDQFQNIFFANNSAIVSGKSLYGGLLDRCTVNPQAEIPRTLLFRPTNIYVNETNGGIYTITDIKEHAITSDSVRVCFCNRGKPDCSYQPDTVRVRKGERFVLPVVAVDQIGRSTPSRIHSSLQSQGGTFIEGQLLQSTSETCTELQYNILSPHDSEQLLLYAEGPCRDIGMSQRSINVTFLPCDCPIGFERLNATQTNCSCICDPPIRSFVSDCFIETESIVRQGNFWITYVNSSLLNERGYILYEHCPFDYCFPSTISVNINLNIPDGSDAQCAFNRSGVLCGSCQEGFSLSFGSSRCMPCSNHWLALLIPFAIAGIALVAFLLAFNLTVAVGSINGLIFYANIVAANRTLFLPFEGVKVLTTFVTWLNLDFGFETCFYNEMDGYVKVWLQLVFPTYIIVMVAMVILISEKSRWFSRLMFRINRNPVAVLATLILLSYAKLLRTIIAALSFTTLDYPDGSHKTVWLYDANIPYLEGKHIPLFIAALLILLVGVTFTLLLFLWQWLLKLEHYTNWRMLKWCNNTRLHSFMDVYHAPHNNKTRYWTGLLLLACVLLYIVSSLDHVIGDARVNLLSTICVVGGLLLLKEIQRDKTYKEHVNNLFESCFIFNLLIFASATYQFRETNGDQTVIAFISISTAFITFVGVLLYHSYLLLKRYIGSLSKFKYCKVCCVTTNQLVRKTHVDSDPPIAFQFVNNASSELKGLTEHTVSEIDGIPTTHAEDSYSDSVLDSGSVVQLHTQTSEKMSCSSDMNDQSTSASTQVESKPHHYKKHKCIGHHADSFQMQSFMRRD